jgi:hypothetical protein
LTTESIDPIQHYYGDHEVSPSLDEAIERFQVPLYPEELDPKIPVGAPLFLEGLGKAHLVVDGRQVSLSPRSPRSCTPGSKSPVLLSPSQEHAMEVSIRSLRDSFL